MLIRNLEMPMFMNVMCPYCGHKCRVLESALGQAVNCPACLKPFECGSVSPRSLVTKPISVAAASPAVEATPNAREAQPNSGEKIHYRCSRCQRSLESPAEMAGQKLNCPDCGQRLQIPAGPAPVAVSTVFPGSPSPSVTPGNSLGGPAPSVAPKKRKQRTVKIVAPAPAADRREACLECGVDVTGRKRLQTCPDCGSLFCSAQCYRSHRYHSHSSRG